MIMSERILSSHIYYFYICKRKVWFASRYVGPSYDNEMIQIGKLISEKSYIREKRNVTIVNVFDGSFINLDIMRATEKGIVVGEIKKSSACLKASKMQLAYYLYLLKSLDIEAIGLLLIPKEKKKLKIELTEKLENELQLTIQKVREIIQADLPPEATWNNLCKKCGYVDFCWS